MIRSMIATIAAVGALGAVSVSPAIAASPALTCMEPTILDTNPNPTFNLLPGVFAAPSADSKKIGIATSVVYAVWPLKEVEGFLEVIHPNGSVGWVEANALEPWHNVSTPTARCTARLLPGGKPHASYS
jgi:hypothetical protein